MSEEEKVESKPDPKNICIFRDMISILSDSNSMANYYCLKDQCATFWDNINQQCLLQSIGRSASIWMNFLYVKNLVNMGDKGRTIMDKIAEGDFSFLFKGRK